MKIQITLFNFVKINLIRRDNKNIIRTENIRRNKKNRIFLFRKTWLPLTTVITA